MTSDCAFCEIVNGRAPARFVAQWEDAVAFFPLAPATVGHTLVVPRRHVADIWSADKTLGARLIKHVLDLSQVLRVALDPDGMNVINSAGRVATQTIMHLHVHLVPRYEGDDMGEIWPEQSNVPENSSLEALSKIRSVQLSSEGGDKR